MIQDLYKQKKSLELSWEQEYNESGKYTLNMVKIDDKISSKFYVYAIEWYEDRIDFLIDDAKYFSFQNDGKNDFNTWPFNQRFHLLINIAVGGDWPGSPDETTQFPTEMEVEYVRVYEKIQP